MSDEALAGHLADGPKAGVEAVAERLVAAANDAGGPDNVTVVLGHFRAVQEGS